MDGALVDQYEAGVTPCNFGSALSSNPAVLVPIHVALIDTIPTQDASIHQNRFSGAPTKYSNYMEGVFTSNSQLTSFDYSLDIKVAVTVLADSDTIDRYEQAIRNRDGM